MTTYAVSDPAVPGSVSTRRLSVPAGHAVVLRPERLPWSLSVVPGAGGTALAEVTASLPSTELDSCVWHELGVAGSKMLYCWKWPVSAVRVSAMTADAVVELCCDQDL